MCMNSHNELPLAVVVCGPTGIGKTSFAIELARRFGGDIVGADSMQLYRHMDIGTAKPEPADRERVPRHLVNLVELDARDVTVALTEHGLDREVVATLHDEVARLQDVSRRRGQEALSHHRFQAQQA